MSQRDWYDNHAHWLVVGYGLIFVFLASYSAFYSHGYQAANKDNEASYEASRAAEEAYIECSRRASIEEALRCYAEAEKASREDYRAQQDLNAQREMAEWAKWMFWATAIVGALTIGVAITAAYWARGAILKMAETNAIMQSEQRPWVAVSATIADGVGYEGDLLRIRFAVTLKNTGRAAAFVRMEKSYLVLPRRKDPPEVIRPTGGEFTCELVPEETVEAHIPYRVSRKSAESASTESDDGGIRPLLVLKLIYDAGGQTETAIRMFSVWRRQKDGPLPALQFATLPPVGKIKPDRLYVKAERWPTKNE